MKKIGLGFLIVLLVAAGSFAQDYKGKARVGGIVTDEQGNPIEGVTVKLFSPSANGGIDVKSDADGKWLAAWIRGGEWNVDFERIGFEPKKIVIQLSEAKKNPDIEIKLVKMEGLVLTDNLKETLEEGNLLFADGKYAEAIAVFKKMVEDNTEAIIIHVNIGNAYFEMEDYDKAEEHYKTVLDQDPKNQDMMLLIGNCYANRDDIDKALEWYSKIEFESISDPTVLYNIGTNFYNLGKPEDALRYYRRAVELKEDFEDGIYQLGLTLLTMTQYKESITVFEKYLKYDSESERAGQVRGFIEFLKTKIQ